MAKPLIFLTCLITIVVGSVVSAAWVPLMSDPVPLSSLPEGLLIVGDKLFAEFELYGSATGGAIAPDMDSVFVQSGVDDATGDYGLRFLLALDAGSGQLVNANLSFMVAVPLGPDNMIIDSHFNNYQEYPMIKDVSIVLTGISTNDTGVVNVSETVWDAPIPTGEVLASLSCSKWEGGAVLKDYAEFDPVYYIWVRKDLSVSGGTGLYGGAHLSEFFQFYSQIPEPATVVLLGLGALVLLRKRRK